MQQSNVERFTSTGFILTAIGSSIGLGNMWKFPYITGQYGGAAFFLLFIVCLLIVGLPVLLAEMAIGRSGRGNGVTSFLALSSNNKKWGSLGFISVLAAFLVLSFYSVVAGWTMHYAVLSFSDLLYTDHLFTERFTNFTAGYMPLMWQTVAMVGTGIVVGRGISGGIEKFNKILVPGLVIILIILMGRALTLPNAMAGVEFFLKPDFSKLTAESALVALGHAFFSLSLGMGIMITYGSYMKKQQSLKSAVFAVGVGDLLYALIAGLIIFPTSFAYNIEPTQGAGLAFMALPAAFAAMPFGHLFGGLFFLLLAIAALTSAVSILEVPVAYAMGKWKWTRVKATVITTFACFLVGALSALSGTSLLADFTLFGKSFMDLVDFLTSNILLPFGGLIVTIFAGYAWKQVRQDTGIDGAWFKWWMFLLRYIAPVLILAILLYSAGILNFFN
ncbi:sodium-dependent transporter [Paenibacillus sp. 481]|uniref:sodium-dependent transporter n=1 Tax=Paenibacillus sp. 481 TaxID=2835869 RepID=UPI001E62EBF8|nr:sodium-dependent transporter [Paenibacillus sp. 481]UHA75484.1 sodium-dependent transporter [Paenibacillus sp. 481]